MSQVQPEDVIPESKRHLIPEFNSAARDFAYKKSKERPDDLFLELKFIEWITGLCSKLSDNLYEWRRTSRKDPQMHRLCSGMRMFKELPNIIQVAGVSKTSFVLREDISAIVFISYVRCLNLYDSHYSKEERKPVTFTKYMVNTLPHRVGILLLRFLPSSHMDTGHKVNGYYTMEYQDKEFPWPILSARGLGDIVNRNHRNIRRMLDKRPPLKERLFSQQYVYYRSITTGSGLTEA